MFSKRIKKVVHWLAIAMLVMPLNILSIKKAQAAIGTNIVINELLPHPKNINWDGQGGVKQSEDEWIELYNPTNFDVDISGWELSDAGNKKYTFPILTIIPAKGFITIYSSTNGNSIDLNDPGDTINLKNNTDLLKDSVIYTSSNEDVSLGRVGDGEDNDLGSDFKEFGGSNGVPTPNAKNVPSQPAITSPVSVININADNTTISGTTTANRTVKLFKGGDLVTSQSSDGSGAFSFSSVALTQNTTNNFSVTAENGTNAVTSATVVPSIIEDSTNPTLSVVSIQSNNANINRAKTGDIVTVNITASENITSPTVTIDGKSSVVSGSLNSYSATRTLDGTESEGVLSILISGMTDLAGNAGASVSFTTDGSSVIFDKTSPTSLNVGPTVYTNILNSNIGKSVSYDTSVAGLGSVSWTKKTGPDGGILTIDGATDSDTGSTRTLSADQDGNYEVEVKVTDKAGNFDSGTFVLTRDTIKPTPTITSTSNLYNSSPIDVEIKFNEIVAGFTKDDLTVTNGIVSELSTADNITFIAKITPSSNGSVSVSLASDTLNDLAGNSNNASGSVLSFDFDQTAPTGTLTINAGKEVTNSKEVDLTIAGIDNLSGVEQMRISQNLVLATSIDQNVNADWTPFATAKQFALTIDKDGNYAIYMQLKDKAGNISSIISDTIFYSSSFIGDDVTNPTVNSVNSSSRIIDKISENGLYLEVSDQTVGDANIVIGEYNSLPVDSKPTGISILGKTFEIKTDNTTVFPISLKYYYTSNDLVDAGVLDETKITGIYYYDIATDTWSLYADTGIVTSNTTIGGIEYEGYVWANLDHLTPLTYGADQKAPVKPNNFQVNVISENEVKLSWDKVSDAEKYVVRYKKNISEQNFVYVSIDKNNSSASIINLEGATEYVFEIASVDKVNNYSSFASIIATTKKSPISELINNIGLVEVAQAQEEIRAPKITTTTTEIKDEGEVKATNDSQNDDEKGESRALVTIIILLIALAAGVGGYYGYEYWLLNGQKKAARKNGKSSKKSGRW